MLKNREEERRGGSAAVSPAAHSVSAAGGKSDLLMRFFESDFFDAWIAVTYLHKNLSPGLHDYLCNRLFALPEVDAERFLSQLCQLCVSRPDPPLERVLVELCAQSLRIAVKTYWLLLAISQDNPRDEHVASLRDACEQAALEGHWDLPFKDAKLPPPNPRGLNRFLRLHITAADQSAAEAFSTPPPPISTPNGVLSTGYDSGVNLPSLPSRGSEQWEGGLLSPDRPLRPTSPDGLWGGIYSSVAMDAGVEGLIYGGSPQESRHTSEIGSPLCAADTSQSHSQPGSGGRSDLTPLRTRGFEDGGMVSPPFSPPNSPRRRETTFGATLDFVEALCTASSNLTAFQPEDRVWALHKVLRSINTEIERASAAGVAIWFPMGRRSSGGGQRVVRLAAKESRLLNSREKAPFTLFVEVLTEAAPSAAALDSAPPPAATGSNAADERPADEPPLQQAMAVDAAAAEAAVHGIPWVPHHHRRSSSQDTSSSSVLAAAAVAAVQGSSAAGGRAALPPPIPESAPPAQVSAVPQAHSLSFELPQAGAAPATSTPSLTSQRSEVSTFGTDLSMADFASDASHSPPTLRPNSGNSVAGSSSGGGSGEATLPAPSKAGASGSQPALQRELSLGSILPGSSSLPPLPPGHVQGGGTWIGGHLPRPASHASLAAAAPLPLPADVSGGLSAALAGLRGEAPIVRVRLVVVNDTPLLPAGRSSSAASSLSVGSDSPPDTQLAPATSAAPRSASRAAVHPLTAAVTALPPPSPQCSRSGWLCKLGLCKSCNAAAKAPPAADTAPPALQPQLPRPRVRVQLTVHSGLNLAIKRNSGQHKRMPSHEALLFVARQHKLPPPPQLLLPPPPPSPPARSPVSSAAATPTQGGSSFAEEAVKRQREAEAVYGEPWEARRARVRESSPHGQRPGWDLCSVIVKSGDDCRQELLAMQLISTFHDIFTEARLPLWLRPYEVLVTSNRTALIEMVPNAPSVHSIKTRCPPGTSLRDHLAARFVEGTPSFKRAQRNFVESLAAYSLVCYLLQIKDRHNGNVLLDDDAHVIHIDFGFMLSNSPGGVNFESAPFKLTRELLEVMDSNPEGRPSELFDYFKVLMIQGFLAARRHSDRIVALVEMMAGSGCPCFKNRVSAVQGLVKRLSPGLAEPAVVEVVLSLISDSLDAWRTRQYDYYQRVLNGIL